MAKPSLLTLPSEIREKIWKFVCDDSVVTLCWRDCWPQGVYQLKIVAENNRSEILFVCRQIYTEVWTQFVQSSQIRCGKNIMSNRFLRMSPPGWQDSIIDLPMASERNAALIKLRKALPSPKILRLYRTGYVPSRWHTIPEMRELSGLELLRKAQYGADIVELMHQCPDLDLSYSAVVLLGPVILRGSLLAYLAEFRSRTMTITFGYRDYSGLITVPMISKKDFDEEDYAVEPKLVERPTTA